MPDHTLCPCGSHKILNVCCGLFLSGEQFPQNAERLMRSRYSAYALKKFKYIQETMCGPAAKHFDLKSAEENQQHYQWLALEIVKSYRDPKNPDHAFVEFRALFSTDGAVSILHELSEFIRVNSRWFYTDGLIKKSSRNDLCPCQSGKKFKNCHRVVD